MVGSSQTTLAPGPRYAPATATNGTEDFVVWVDQRSGTTAIVGTRVRSGAVLDPLGIVLDEEAAGVPHVVSIGDAWLVTWNDLGAGNVVRIMAARVSREGRIITPAKVVIESAIGTNLAAIGSRAVAVVWRDDAVHALVLDANANVIALHRIATRTGIEANGVIAAGATQFVMVWETNRMLEAVRLSPAGQVLDATPRPLGAGAFPAIASDGTGFALVAFDWNTETWFTRRIAADLIPGPAHSLPGSTNLGPMTVIWTGARYAAMALQERRQLYAAFLDADGASPPPRILPWPEVSVYSAGVSAVARRGELLVTSIRELMAIDRHVVRAEFFDGATLAKQGPELALSWSGNEHQFPQVAFDGTNTLVVWRERDGIFASRVTPEGQSLDGRGIELAGPSFHWFLRRPAVVFDGTQYIVAWADANAEPGRIFIHFIDPATGTASDAVTIRTGATSDVSLAAGRDATLVTWNATRPTAARIDRASRSLSAPVTLATLASDAALLWLMPDLGFAGSAKIAAPSPTVSLARTASGVTAAYTRPIRDAPYAGVHRSVLRHVAPPVRRRAVR